MSVTMTNARMTKLMQDTTSPMTTIMVTIAGTKKAIPMQIVNPFYENAMEGDGWKNWGKKLVKGISSVNKTIAPVLDTAAALTVAVPPASAAFTAAAAASDFAAGLGDEWDKEEARQSGSGKKKKTNTKRQRDERKALQAYDEFLAFINFAMNKSTTTGEKELHKMGKDLFGVKFQGVFAANDIRPKHKRGLCYLINTKPRRTGGEHWMAVGPDGTIYDSFGREEYGDMTGDAEQAMKETNCGQRSLAWLCVCYFTGMKYAKLI